MYVLELFNGADSPSPRRKSSLKNIKEDNTMPAVTDQPVTQSNPEDKVTIDVPLLIRIMEYAREDAKTDMDLHDVAERLIALSTNGNTLTMTDYESIVGGETDIEEGWSDIKSGLKKGLAAGVLGAAALGAHAGGVSLPNSGGSFPPAAQQTLNQRVQAMKDDEAAVTGVVKAKAADLSYYDTQYLQQVASGKLQRPLVSADDAKAELQLRANGKQQSVTPEPSAKPTGPTGFSKEYLQKAADTNRTGRYLISVEKAQELLKQSVEKESVSEDITRFKDLVGKMRRV